MSQYLFRYWQFTTGKFNPTTINGRKIWFGDVKVEDLKVCLSSSKVNEVCINGNVSVEILELFEKYYPKKSRFEL